MRKPSANWRSIRARTRYLSYNDLATIAYQLADEVFSAWLGPMPILTVLGGEAGDDRLRGILELPKQTAFGKPAYPDLFDKAAVLFRSMILNHPFVDGNKRMAAASALVFLLTNGLVPCPTQNEVVELALNVASGRNKELRFIGDWFRTHTVSKSALIDALAMGALDEIVTRLPGDAGLANRPILQLIVQELSRR